MTTTVPPKEFGFYPVPLSIKTGPVTISSLPKLEQIANGVRASSSIENNWYYAPPQRVSDLLSRKVRVRPYPTRVFGLPKTHRFEHMAATNEEHLDFHLWALSFFVGMRLTAAATENAFLDATPVKPHKLVDFIPVGSTLTHAVELAEDFWNMTRDKPCCAKRFGAAVHALFLSQNPRNLPFEEFVLLYMAIDACYRLAVELHGLPERPKHAERIPLMCKQFGIECPDWADPNAPCAPKKGSIVTDIRNNTLHEALFKDAPLGFKGFGGGTNPNLLLEMRALVCRLLVALIGGRGADYVRSPVNTRQMYSLDLSVLCEANTAHL